MLKGIFFAIYVICITSYLISVVFANQNNNDLPRERRSFMNKCVNDKDCKVNEHCDHQWPNPVGDCKVGKEDGRSCMTDRHCASKVCHLLTCRRKRPVKDGPCTNHDECIPEQYCCPNKQKCLDRYCTGWCWFSDHKCLSNTCSWLRCKTTDTCLNNTKNN